MHRTIRAPRNPEKGLGPGTDRAERKAFSAQHPISHSRPLTGRQSFPSKTVIPGVVLRCRDPGRDWGVNRSRLQLGTRLSRARERI